LAIWCSENPEPIELKFGVTDYVRDGTTHANFGVDPLGAEYWANTPLVPQLFVFFTSYFFDSIKQATADIAQPILTRSGSNNVSV